MRFAKHRKITTKRPYTKIIIIIIVIIIIPWSTFPPEVAQLAMNPPSALCGTWSFIDDDDDGKLHSPFSMISLQVQDVTFHLFLGISTFFFLNGVVMTVLKCRNDASIFAIVWRRELRVHALWVIVLKAWYISWLSTSMKYLLQLFCAKYDTEKEI